MQNVEVTGMLMTDAIVGAITNSIHRLAAFLIKKGLNKEKISERENVARRIDLRSLIDNGDFSDLDEFSHELENVELNIDLKDHVSFSAILRSTNLKRGELEIGNLSGEGVHINGMVYIIYSGKKQGTEGTWKGVMALEVPGDGRSARGYWLTEDIQGRGKFVFGHVNIRSQLGFRKQPQINLA